MGGDDERKRDSGEQERKVKNGTDGEKNVSGE